MAADNRLSPAILDQKWLLTTSHIFTIKWFKMLFHLTVFILICYKKYSHSKGKWPVLLVFLHFWGPVLHIMWTLSFSWGWSGGAMVLGKLPVQGRPTGVGVVWTFFLSSIISLSFSLSLGDGPI